MKLLRSSAPPISIEKTRVTTANIVFDTPWYTSHRDSAVVDVNIEASELKVFARGQLQKHDTWMVRAAKSVLAFATMRTLSTVVRHHEDVRMGFSMHVLRTD